MGAPNGEPARAPRAPAATAAGAAQADAAAVFDLLEKELEAAAVAQSSKLRGEGLPPLRVAPAETDQDGAGADMMTIDLIEGVHVDGEPSDRVQEWLRRAKSWLQLLNPKATVPQAARLPASAVAWGPQAAVLRVLTEGRFDPPRDLPSLAVGATAPPAGLTSVCCVTSDRRRSFHPLIYENFAKQTYEPRELVIVHTGELPSEFFAERAQQDARVVYRFFPVSREAPGSPRLSDEQTGRPWDAVLVDDDPSEVTHWGPGDPWQFEISREGWTKGLKRNVACCIARGAAIVHFDEGCLYAPNYLERVLAELLPARTPAAAVLSKWYTVGISDSQFRIVDLLRPEPMWEYYGQQPREGQEKDQLNHGFSFAFSRSAWERQPFPDMETIGSQDGEFMRALRLAGVPVRLVDPSGGFEALAACGWHREATCGSKDAPANINHSQVLNFMMFRGEEAQPPRAFAGLLPMVQEMASDLVMRRERYLRDLVEEHGASLVCAHCNFAIALLSEVRDDAREVSTAMRAVDGYDLTVTFAKHDMKFDVVELASAGGAVANGPSAEPPGDHDWLAGVRQRMAMCRNCGFQLGWRYEALATGVLECASPGCRMQVMDAAAAPRDVTGKSYCCIECMTGGAGAPRGPVAVQVEAPSPQGPLRWGLIWRHLRIRRRAGEDFPDESDRSRHKETTQNYKRSDVCPAGHPLRVFCTGQGNGGALPSHYICDSCDKPARGSQHLWGCGTCDYDICMACRSKRL